MPIPLRGDFDAPRLRAIARSTKDAVPANHSGLIGPAW
jgi:hypothetical protein